MKVLGCLWPHFFLLSFISVQRHFLLKSSIRSRSLTIHSKFHPKFPADNHGSLLDQSSSLFSLIFVPGEFIDKALFLRVNNITENRKRGKGKKCAKNCVGVTRMIRGGRSRPVTSADPAPPNFYWCPPSGLDPDDRPEDIPVMYSSHISCNVLTHEGVETFGEIANGRIEQFMYFLVRQVGTSS